MIKACLSIKGSLVKPPLHHFVACTYVGKKEFKNWRKVDSYGYGQGKTMGHYLVQGMRIPTLPSQVPPSAWRTMVCLGLGNINVPPPLQVGGNVLSGDYYRACRAEHPVARIERTKASYSTDKPWDLLSPRIDFQILGVPHAVSMLFTLSRNFAVSNASAES